MSVLDYEKRFSQLNPNRAQGRTSPHKIAMLLAVMELIETILTCRFFIFKVKASGKYKPCQVKPVPG